MPSFRRKGDYLRLLSETDTHPFDHLLQCLRAEDSALRPFESWSQVIAFMHDGSSEATRKDAILRAILGRHGAQPDTRWTTILLAMFWPGLTSLFGQRRSWDRDADELWNVITWRFLQAAHAVDVRRRPDRLAAKLINDTASMVHREYRRRWRYEGVTVPLSLDHPPALDSVRGVDLQGIEQRQLRRAAEQRLRGWLAAGRISQEDFALVVGTRIYGRRLHEVAGEAGLSYEAAKKRRQRAENFMTRQCAR